VPAIKLSFHPASTERWRDLEQLFGERGACGGCWCMAWRLNRAEFNAGKGAGNKRRLKKLVAAEPAPGILAYADGQPVGWCSVAPRARFPALERSRIFRPIDDQPVWSISCLFVTKPYRRKGISVALLNAAAEYAFAHGARIVEGYPTELGKSLPDVFVWTGIASAFRRAGFREAARRSKARPMMRRLSPGPLPSPPSDKPVAKVHLRK
jgi:GNAT superfamily N-acetyltransferase